MLARGCKYLLGGLKKALKMLRARGAPKWPSQIALQTLQWHPPTLHPYPHITQDTGLLGEWPPHILPSPTPICSEPPDLWSPFLHISRQLRGNRDHITKQVIAVPREIRKGVTTIRTTRSGYKNMNVQGMKTLLEIKTMLVDMAISTEGLEDVIEKIFWKTQRKGWKMGVKR